MSAVSASRTRLDFSFRPVNAAALARARHRAPASFACANLPTRRRILSSNDAGSDAWIGQVAVGAKIHMVLVLKMRSLV